MSVVRHIYLVMASTQSRVTVRSLYTVDVEEMTIGLIHLKTVEHFAKMSLVVTQ